MLGKITTDPPYLTIDNFEDCLSSDDVLVHFFNDFLSLPSFPECVQYNQETGVFEVVSDAAVALSRRIRSALQYFKSQPLTDPTELTARPVVDNHYTVLCLDREQGVEWILKERLPLFIESDCYFEYRLAKLLSQWGPQGWNQKRDGTSVQPPVTTEPVCPSPGPDDRETLMKVLYVSLGQASVTDMLTLAKDKDKQLPVCTQSVRTPVCSLGREGQRGPASACFSCIPDSESYALSSSLLVSFPLSSSLLVSFPLSSSLPDCPLCSSLPDCPLSSSLPDCPLSSSLLDWDKRRGDHSAEQEMKVYLTETEAKTEIEAGTTDEVNGEPKPQSPACSTTDEETVGPHTESPCEGGPATSHSRLKEQQEEGGGSEEENDHEFYDVTASIHGDRQGLGDFKDFLKGTLGEKLLRLWMDIERLKTLQDDRRRIRHLVQMRSCYLLTGGQSSLNGELLTRLGLSTSPCWREDRLQRVQPRVTEALLCYWGPRFMLCSRGPRFMLCSRGPRFMLCSRGPRFMLCSRGPRFMLCSRGPRFMLCSRGPRFMLCSRGPRFMLCSRGPRFMLCSRGPRFMLCSRGPRFMLMLCSRGPRFMLCSRGPRFMLCSRGPRFMLCTRGPRFMLMLCSRGPRFMLCSRGPRFMLCSRGPRFRMSRRAVDPLRLSLWRNGQLHPPSGVKPNPRYINLQPLRPHTSIPRPTIRPDTSLPRDLTPTPAHTQTGYASSSPVVWPWRMERMLQALCVDSQAGFYFTRFYFTREHSGNPLWENAVHCWCDLQQYHQLFYQDGLDPYRVQRQAHLLYSTYVCSAACSSIGVEEESRERVYTGLTPPFEELFDWVEEHTLTLLLEPWTLLTTRDTDTFQKVAVREETRQVESEPYGELKTLYEEAVHRLVQHDVAQACRPPPPPLEVARSPAMWSAVPERYRGYRLGSLLGHRTELQHFTSFLQDNTASIHLACWQDIENYRRIPHKDKAQREDKSRLIKDKYLNRKYFFGPDSPATRQQQEEVMRLAGGWGRLLHDRLCAPVLVDIQSIIRNHIETRWLPVFLTTPEFNERQQQRVRPRGEDGVSDHVYQRHRNKREVWKQVKGTWMTSAGEILAVRRALLNPVTCHQFRRFVSLKGDFLENDILFWLEVQRYKDLCHSHCVEAVVQDKVSTIISCFIQSSVPPALQIDIPPEQATHILERRGEMGPYVFREAQMCVFSELLKLWPEFLSFSSGVQEEEVLPLLQNSVNKQSAKLQRRRRREEEKEVERRAQEEVERRAQEEVERRAQEEVERFPEEHEEKHKGLQESRELLYPSQQLSWSYSKYMVALEREEVLLRRQEVTSSTGTDSSSAHSLKSKSSRHSRQSQHQTQQRTESTPDPAEL
ncbi:regulator of G-protein signaling 22-like isoform X6 [Oncorhynchus keta]|uniref:regulator of G-protein signaling 22-like isoform X6 n=1 Tax=Oncorhynchus keta TaxID=8018 RepID=UPI00227AE8DD|nr:regulator of G-protein signaling 22-like isoform X6 [Oncorhynchus keta]